MKDHHELQYKIPPQIFRDSSVASHVKNNQGPVAGGRWVLSAFDGDVITAAPESQSLASTCPLGSLLEVYYSLVLSALRVEVGEGRGVALPGCH